MKTVQAVVEVDETGEVSLHVQAALPPGSHEALIRIVDNSIPKKSDSARNGKRFPVIEDWPWPKGLSLRREDMYDERPPFWVSKMSD